VNSSDLALTIIVCVIVLAATIASVAKTIARRHQPNIALASVEVPPFDAPTEVWVAYYEACGRSNEALANAATPFASAQESTP
jgi:hypothetical protein